MTAFASLIFACRRHSLIQGAWKLSELINAKKGALKFHA